MAKALLECWEQAVRVWVFHNRATDKILQQLTVRVIVSMHDSSLRGAYHDYLWIPRKFRELRTLAVFPDAYYNRWRSGILAGAA